MRSHTKRVTIFVCTAEGEKGEGKLCFSPEERVATSERHDRVLLI